MSETFSVNGRRAKDFDEASAFIKDFLRHTLEETSESGYGKSYDFDLYLPWMMDWILNVPHEKEEEFTPTHELETLYMEVGWELVMQGFLRPGPRGTNGEVPGGSYGKGFSLTGKGWKWVREDAAQSQSVPASQTVTPDEAASH